MANKIHSSEETRQSHAPLKTRFILVHGDKGGVGKSFVAQAICDVLYSKNQKLAIIDADTANPDVSRMFAATVPCLHADIRKDNGWMDVMDFVLKHPGYTVVMNTPAGIGQYMKADMTSFSEFLAQQECPAELEMWWAMNIQHDSVNLFSKAYTDYGQFFKKIVVVCNLHFSNGDKSHEGPFFLWNECPLRTKLENNNGTTLFFPGLHLRVVCKLFAPVNIMPFVDAVDAVIGEKIALEHSERWKLQQWREDINKLFVPVLGI